MEEESLAQKAIDNAEHARYAYCKFISANDSGETGGHQSGILLSTTAKPMFFPQEAYQEHIAKRQIHVLWQDDFTTDSTFTWYESKKELRLTRFGRGFDLLGSAYTGALFILTCEEDQEAYRAYLLNTDDAIQTFLFHFGLSPADTNRLLKSGQEKAESRVSTIITAYAKRLGFFPSSDVMSDIARRIAEQIYQDNGYQITEIVKHSPDWALLDWTKQEYRLFQAVEDIQYGPKIRQGFENVNAFISMANEVLNRRKSRAGKSLEHHLAAIFDIDDIQYTAQGVTEGNKKPDFIFPSVEAYHDLNFPTRRICTLAAKTTCKDRWRQVLNEADRMRSGKKYLCTLQQGISAAQLAEMQTEHVQLVVPGEYIRYYPTDYKNKIWSLSHFISYVQELERWT